MEEFVKKRLEETAHDVVENTKHLRFNRMVTKIALGVSVIGLGIAIYYELDTRFGEGLVTVQESKCKMLKSILKMMEEAK